MANNSDTQSLNVKANLSAFKKYRYMVLNLIKKDITTKYRRSVLGIAWSVLNPLLMMIVITTVFQYLFKTEIENFSIYYLTGSLIFNFVADATTSSMQSVLGSAALIKKVYIPKYMFPLQKCLFAFVNMLFSMIALVIMYLVIRFIPPWTVIMAPIPMIYALVFSFGLGLILSSLIVFFRDIGHLYSVFITVWMYLTPVMYPMEALPERVAAIVKLNPLYHMVTYFRNVAINGVIPSLTDNLICIGWGLAMLIIGLIVFKKTQDKFILYI